MSITLTKDADKLMYLIYEEYLARRNSNAPYDDATNFADPSEHPSTFVRAFEARYMCALLTELKSNGLVRKYQRDSFRLTAQGIAHMEQHPACSTLQCEQNHHEQHCVERPVQDAIPSNQPNFVLHFFKYLFDKLLIPIVVGITAAVTAAIILWYFGFQ